MSESSPAAAVSCYHSDGFVFPFRVFPGTSAELFASRYGAFREEVARAAIEATPQATDVQRKVTAKRHLSSWSEMRFKSHLVLPWLYDLLVFNQDLLQLCRGFLKSDSLDAAGQDGSVVIWSSDWCVKPRGGKEHFTWHQDSRYSGFDDDSGVTVWIAFSRIGHDAGPVLFKRSSNKLGPLAHVEDDTDRTNMLAFGQRIPEGDDERNWYSACPTVAGAPLEVGEASAHSFSTVHSSQANGSGEDRVGLAVRIVTRESGHRLGRRDRVTLMRGGEPHEQRALLNAGGAHDGAAPGGFELEDHVPVEELGDREVKEWRQSMDREKEMYFASAKPGRSYK